MYRLTSLVLVCLFANAPIAVAEEAIPTHENLIDFMDRSEALLDRAKDIDQTLGLLATDSPTTTSLHSEKTELLQEAQTLVDSVDELLKQEDMTVRDWALQCNDVDNCFDTWSKTQDYSLLKYGVYVNKANLEDYILNDVVTEHMYAVWKKQP